MIKTDTNKDQLVRELEAMRSRAAELEKSEAAHKQVKRELEDHQSQLEMMVQERTDELKELNEKLRENIAKRSALEAELKETERKYRTTFQSANDILIQIDHNGQILDVNYKLKEIGGYEREELVGKKIRSLTKIMTRKSIGIVMKNFIKRIAGINVPPYEVQMFNKDGKLMTVEVNAVALKRDDRIVGDLAILRDVTERKQAAEALRASEGLFKSLASSSPVGIYIIQDGQFQYVNRRFQELTGYREDELLGTDSLRLVVPEDRDAVRENATKMLKGERSVPYEFRVITKDGEKRWIIETVTSINYHGKRATLGNYMDITERKQAEDALRESEHLLRTVVTGAPVIIFATDRHGIFTFSEGKGLRTLGYTSGKVIGQSVFKVYKRHPKVIADFRKALKGKEFTSVVSIENLVLEMWYSPIRDYNGDVAGVINVATDITERSRAEERVRHAAEEWRTTFDSITDPISIHDRDYRILRVNRAFADLFHMKPQQLIGKNCYEVMHATEGPPPNCPHKRTLETAKPEVSEFYEPHLGMYLLQSTSPVFNDKGEIISTVHIARDVTRRKQHEEQLIMTDRLASIGELVSGIAHELNNPLTSVIGFSQLLKEADVSPEAKEDLDVISKEAERAAVIVKNLLTFARKHEPVKQRSHVNNIIENVIKLRAYEQKVSNITLRKRLAHNLPEIMIDYFQMQQVFLNIIVNAEAAMLEAHKKGTLTISTRKIEGIIRISFTDDGPGISKENLNRIFNPFFTTKEVGKGTGLGLSICHGIVTTHGGKIYARSKPGSGATFVVELPADNS